MTYDQAYNNDDYGYYFLPSNIPSGTYNIVIGFNENFVAFYTGGYVLFSVANGNYTKTIDLINDQYSNIRDDHGYTFAMRAPFNSISNTTSLPVPSFITRFHIGYDLNEALYIK